MSSELRDFVLRHPRWLVITGAGISAPSGIPTYRDALGNWQGRTPIQHGDFLSDARTRRRYWARSMAGWPAVASARPNSAHLALAELEKRGHIELLVTQNVDRLHQQAGSQQTVDLHGRLDRVKCLDCGAGFAREALQRELEALNGPIATSNSKARPDGDAELETDLAAFREPSCPACGGTLMPDVVFFGGHVPRSRVEQVELALARADALVAIGTSLQVFSGYRFCRAAHALGKPVALINPGNTRADDIATLHIKRECGPALEELLVNLQAPPSAPRSHSPAPPPPPGG